MSNFHIGDEVSITGRIKYIDDDELECRIELITKKDVVISEWIDLTTLTLVKPYQRKLNVGDRVVFKESTTQYLWIAGQQWLRISNPDDNTYHDRESITFDEKPELWEYYPRNVVAEDAATTVSKCTRVWCSHNTLIQSDGGAHCLFDRCPNGLSHCPIHPILRDGGGE